MFNKFITFEGLDGSGKTTVSEKVAERLINEGFNISYLNKKSIEGYSPYVTKHLETIKRVLWDYHADDPLYELGDEHWLFLNLSWFSAVYNCLIEKELSQNKIVIVDNWYYKLYCRFSIKPTFNDEYLNDVFSRVPSPDLVLFLDVNPDVAIQRRERFSITETGQMDREHNFVNYQTKVRKRMLELSISNNWPRFNNNWQGVDKITEEITERCMTYLMSRSLHS